MRSEKCEVRNRKCKVQNAKCEVPNRLQWAGKRLKYVLAKPPSYQCRDLFGTSTQNHAVSVFNVYSSLEEDLKQVLALSIYYLRKIFFNCLKTSSTIRSS